MDRQYRGNRSDRAGGNTDAFRIIGFLPSLLQAIDIALLILEFQRIKRDRRNLDRLPWSVKEILEPFPRTDPQMMIAMRADMAGLDQVFLKDDLAAAETFAP